MQELFLDVMYWVLWASVWFSLLLCLFNAPSNLFGYTEREQDVNGFGMMAFGILGIFALLLLHTLGLT